MVKNQMNAKNILVSFAAIVMALFLVSTVAAAEITDTSTVYIDDVAVGSDVVSVVEGDTIKVKVVFISDIDASDVKIKAEIEGYRVDVDDVTNRFDIEEGKRYSKTLSLTIPEGLKDEVSEDATLDIKIYNRHDESELDSLNLRVQRQSYTADVMSISTTQSAEAGLLFPVDVVLKNTGYNDLDDVYVTVAISELGVSRTSYFGDLVALEDNSDDDDDTDTVSGRIYLQIPEDATDGVYSLEVKASSEDMSETAVKDIVVKNDFSGSNVFATVTSKTVAVGENAEYSILIVNPTNKLKVYNIATESTDLSVSSSDMLVAVPAGLSKTVKIMAKADEEGIYNFNVNVFAGEKLLNTVTLTADVEGSSISSPMVVLTVVLAIVFIVLLIVLFVLVGKKPEKSEEFGESYY